jgi:large-conductance mechanosensitive channel
MAFIIPRAALRFLIINAFIFIVITILYRTYRTYRTPPLLEDNDEIHGRQLLLRFRELLASV